MRQSRRRRSWLPWVVAAALVAALILTRRDVDGKPRLDGAPKARVQRVVDGDTVRLAGLGSVRLIGINTPEVYGHVQCFGPEASAFAKRALRRGLQGPHPGGPGGHDPSGRPLPAAGAAPGP